MAGYSLNCMKGIQKSSQLTFAAEDMTGAYVAATVIA